MQTLASSPPRVKVLCTHGGAVLPRPLDGRLRHVGGDTRVTSVPRDVTHHALLTRVRSLFDAAPVQALKYQPPHDDLDSLVSLLDDDDVTHMLEEFENFHGFPRLRIFAFGRNFDITYIPHTPYFDLDERENERRYLDALNCVVSDRNSSTENFESCCCTRHRHYEYECCGGHARHDSSEFSQSVSPRFNFGEFGETGQPVRRFNYGSPVMDGFVYVGEKRGFPASLGYLRNFTDVCGNCRRNRCVSPCWKQRQLDVDGEYFGGFPSSCPESYHIHNPSFNGYHGCQHGWFRVNESRFGYGGIGTGNEECVNYGNAVNIPFSCQSTCEGYSLASSLSPHEGVGYFKDDFRAEYGVSDALQMRRVGSFINKQGIEESRLGHQPSGVGVDSLYNVPLNLPPIRFLHRNSRVTACPGSLNDLSGCELLNEGPDSGFMKNAQEGSPRFPRVDDQIRHDLQGQNSYAPFKKHGEESVSYDFPESTRPGKNSPVHDSILPVMSENVQCCPSKLSAEVVSESVPHTLSLSHYVGDSSSSGPQECLVSGLNATLNVQDDELDEPGKDSDPHSQDELSGPKFTKTNVGVDVVKLCHEEVEVSHQNDKTSDKRLKLLPVLKASVKKAVLEGAEEVITKSQADTDNTYAEADTDSDGDGHREKRSQVDLIAAEAEALANGLQFIKNEDLEEIRQLGLGTYGTVWYGKWRGSDVAIKRMKDSCFEGKSSERKRVIADFWKEALRMSSLHHPNIVSFYGVVCDAPKGSLATVTEFMVNGSLKQFLKKNDRTVDRRKRLIIAMDVAFGMEYLHGKNVIHFDLKCENLFVNMKDPHRPVCKIGDFGLSKVKQRTLVSGGIRGTLPWMAPELLNSESNMVSDKIDVYSFGIVMWELLTAEEPYAGMSAHALIGGIINNTLRPDIPKRCDPEWVSLMENCWSFDPATRPSFSEISKRLRNMK